MIGECIESVMAQSYQHVEHIVIDGGSTDGTQEVIEKYRPYLAAYISEPDKGLYDALNKGIKMATGDFVGVLHSDDLFYEPDTLKKVVARFETSRADLVYANGIYVPKEDVTEVKRIYKARPFYSFYVNLGWIPLHTTIYVKRELFEEFGYYDDSFMIASDYDISLRWFKNEEIKKCYLDEWVVKMRLGGKSTTAALQKRKSTEDLEIIQRHNLKGLFTLSCKIGQKVPQYLWPRITGMRDENGNLSKNPIRRFILDQEKTDSIKASESAADTSINSLTLN